MRFVIFYFCLFAACKKEPSDLLFLNINIVNSNPQTIYITRCFLDSRPEEIIDSISITKLDSDFNLAINSHKSFPSYLKINLARNYAFIYIDDEPGIKNISINMTQLSSYKITGNQTDLDFHKYYSFSQKVQDSLYVLNNFHQRESQANIKDSLASQIRSLKLQAKKFNQTFAIDSTNEYKVSTKIALETDFLLSEYKDFLPLFESKYKSEAKVSDYLNKAHSFIYLMEHEWLKGDTIPDIQLSASLGNRINFYDSIKSRNILVFWTSYSQPSLKELQLLSSRNTKGESRIFTFSLDQDSSSFIHVVKQFPSQWINFYDFDSWNGRLAHHFLVKELPYYYILDSTGRILQKGTTFDL